MRTYSRLPPHNVRMLAALVERLEKLRMSTGICRLPLACLLVALASNVAAAGECAVPDTLIDDSTREETEIFRALAPVNVEFLDGRRIAVREGTDWAEVGRISKGEVYAEPEGRPKQMLVVRMGAIVGLFDAGAGTFCAALTPVPFRLRWVEAR